MKELSSLERFKLSIEAAKNKDLENFKKYVGFDELKSDFEKDQWLMMYDIKGKNFKDYNEEFIYQMSKTFELCQKHNINFNEALGKIINK